MISALYIPRGRAPQLGLRPRPRRAPGEAVAGGGLCRARDIVNMHVGKDYDGGSSEDDLAAFAATWGIDGDFVGLMTAASAGEPQVRRRSQASVSRTSSIQPAPAMASGKPQVVIASRAT